jgi:hypothetical protein
MYFPNLVMVSKYPSEGRVQQILWLLLGVQRSFPIQGVVDVSVSHEFVRVRLLIVHEPI